VTGLRDGSDDEEDPVERSLLAEQLRDSRPAPGRAFRMRLGAALADAERRARGHARWWSVGCAAAGVLLLLAGVVLAR
jgi:hypothetical protein